MLADAAPLAFHPLIAGIPDDERARLMRSKTEYLDLYARLKDIPLPVSRETGSLLYMLARSTRAKHIVEFGTSFGISTLHLAAAYATVANGGKRVTPTLIHDRVRREGEQVLSPQAARTAVQLLRQVVV